MTNKEILENAIEKAVKNGYNIPKILISHLNEQNEISDGCMWMKNDIIFSHEFASAFWKVDIQESFIESDIKELVIYEKQKLSWDHHLQQMVLEEEPLKYLERFL